MESTNDIYRSARDGSSSNLETLLRSFNRTSKEERSKLIEHKTEDSDQTTTPLIIAAHNGHIKCVETLLSYGADIEARGTVKFQDQIIEGASALWAAAVKGEIDIVKLLIKKGANVNAGTKTNSTPLRAAAFIGRLDIVSYLVEHGADVNVKTDIANTPLMIACYNGHRSVVNYLIDKGAKIDAQDKQGYTALHDAAERGHLDIVKLLIEKGANVNAGTKTNSTPLRAAAHEGRLDIVRYLVEHGADVNAKNIDESTPLMVVCYNGHRSVANYLIDKGAKIDAQDKYGNTALHYAAEGGHLDIVKDLMTKGASQLPNKLGLTPLLLASNSCKTEIVEYFIARPDCSKLDEIHSLELLGATIANDEKAYEDIDKSYEYLMRGMKKRYEGDKCVIKKDILPPIQAYQYREECQNIDKLKGIRNDSHAIHMEGLVVRERILGPNNTKLRYPIRYRGAVSADSGHFEICIQLWKHSMDLAQQNDLAIGDHELQYFAGLFSQMINDHPLVFPSFADVYYALEHAVLEHEKGTQKIQKATENKSIESLGDDLEIVMHRSLYLLTIFQHLNLTETDEQSLHQLLNKYLRMNPRTKEGKTLVHLAVSAATPVDEFHTKDVCTYPCYKTTKLLLQAGAQVNSVDNEGNTPLHTVVMTRPKQGQQETVENIITSLYDFEVHEDLTNAAGKTALEVSATEELKELLIHKRRILLKCLAARAVKHYQLPFTGLVPKSLEKFISTH